MIRVAIATLVAAGLFSFESKKTLLSQRDSCQDKWHYPASRENIKGKVIFHENPDALCGLVPTASVTLIRTTGGDTIRVLELCNLDKKFANGESVVIYPDTNSELANVDVPVDPRSCSLKQTYFGKIESIPKR